MDTKQWLLEMMEIRIKGWVYEWKSDGLVDFG
jgi:hypothetical protein